MPSAQPQNITILGSTGTIGVNTLNVVSHYPDKFKVVALTAGSNVDALLEQCLRFRPSYAVMLNPDSAQQLEQRLSVLGFSGKVLCGVDAMEQVAALDEVQIVMAAIVGAAGLRPTLAAARAGKKLLLANKEALVMAGELFMDTVKKSHATLLPIDSEHNAIFQALPSDYDGDLNTAGVKRIILTGSGGPFRTMPLNALKTVTPKQACAHPKWNMGPKISVDSATMMNKGLEVIEAHWLFNVPVDKIDVVIHPQSVVHSLVEYVDGSILAQLGQPDMRTPIAYGLAYPERIEAGVESLDLLKLGSLDFEAPDLERFPCLNLAYQALNRGDTAPIVLNAANEIAVENFLANRLTFDQIPRLVEHVLGKSAITAIYQLDDVYIADSATRQIAQEWLSDIYA